MALLGSDQSINILIKAKDEASATIDKVRGSINSFTEKNQAAIDASKGFALALGGAAIAVGGFGLKMVQAASDAEQTMVAFETMLGSAEKAKKFYSDLVSFAARTPFELKGLEQSAKKLLAYGFTQEEVLPNLKALGDIASGVGMDKLPNLILAFGQVRAAGKLMGSELRQFTETGVPLLHELSKVTGMTVQEMAGNVGKLDIPFEKVQEALFNLTKEGGRFNNLMDKQSKTLGGMWSNLADAWEQFLRGEGAQLIDWGKQFTLFLTHVVKDVLPEVIRTIKEVTTWFGENKWAVAMLSGVIIGALMPALIAATIAFVNMAIAAAPWIIGGAIIGGIVYGIYYLIKNWDAFEKRVKEIWNGLPWIVKAGIEVIMAPLIMLYKTIEFIVNAFEKLSNWGKKSSGVKILGSTATQTPANMTPLNSSSSIFSSASGQSIPVNNKSNNNTYILNFNDVVAGDSGVKKIINQTLQEINRTSELKMSAGL